MNLIRKFWVVAFLVLSSTIIFALGGADTSNTGVKNTTKMNCVVENTKDHITVIDSYGNKVTVTKPVKTFISLGMGQAYAATRALNAENMVVAVNEYVTRNPIFYPRLSKKEPVTKGEESVNNERLIQLHPDIILAHPFWMPILNDSVKKEIPIISLNLNNTASYLLLGALLGKEAEAKEFVQWIKSYTDIIDKRIATLSKDKYQKVFAFYGGEYGMSAPPPYGTFGKENALRNDLITRAGGNSMSQNIKGDWITVDPEWVIEQNPPVILRECYIVNDKPELGYGVSTRARAKTLLNEIMTKQPAFKGCDAIKNKRVHLIYGDLVEDSWFVSLVYMAKWFHPELFKDLDPVKIHQEFITRFQKLNFDVSKQGAFTLSAQ